MSVDKETNRSVDEDILGASVRIKHHVQQTTGCHVNYMGLRRTLGMD